MDTVKKLEKLSFEETLQIDRVMVTRVIIGLEIGWMLQYGKDVLQTRDIKKAVSYIQQHREKIIDLGRF